MAAKRKKAKASKAVKRAKTKTSPAKKANKTKSKKAVRKTAVRKPAKKKAAPARAKAATAKKKTAPAKAAPTRKKKQIVGEGDYEASRAFLKDQAGFVKENKAKIPELGRQARAALEGSEGPALMAAEAEAKGHSKNQTEDN